MEAAQQALSRPKSLIYEPIVVCCDSQDSQDSQTYRLLDMQVLLTAQNHLLSHACQVIQQQKAQQKHSLQIIDQEKEKIKKAQRNLKLKHSLIQHQVNQDYSRQKAQIVKQTQNIVKLNQDFTRVGQAVYLEAGKAFHTIFMGANAIHRRTDHFFEMSQAITKNLEMIHSTSTLMSEMVEQVRHLAVQAAVVSYQTHSSPNELSRVNFEINRLVNQTMTVKDKMHKVANQLKFNLRELNYLTTDDTHTTRSMLMQVEQVEKVIQELEKLVNSSLIEQNHLSHNPNATHLIQTIERVLKTRQNLTEELSQVGSKQ
jgi:methyl-accepting chemotaxis protein